MKKLKQALSLSLALALSLAMAVPAFAAGTTETVVDEKHGVTITMNGFLRKETHTYRCCEWSDGVNDYVLVPTEMTIYVLADGSTVNVEASDGFQYTQFEEWSEEWSNLNMETDFDNCDYAWTKDTYLAWDSESKAFDPIYNENRVLTGTKLYEITATPADEALYVKDFYSICWVGESDFEKLVPVGGQPTTPTQPEQPAKPETAMPTNDKLTVNGTLADPTVYKINGSNYFKIRDVAALLNGTEKQFSVGYDGALKSVTATTGQGYTKLDTDLVGAAADGNKTATPSNDTIYVNGEKIDATVYKIDGGNYFKLRDLGKALNFSVDWNKEAGMIIDTSKPYTE